MYICIYILDMYIYNTDIYIYRHTDIYIYIYIYQCSDKGGGVVQMVLVDTKRNA